MTLDQLREEAEYTAALPETHNSMFIRGDIALAFVEYVQANEAYIRAAWKKGELAAVRRFNEAHDRLFSLLGEQP